MATTQNSSDSGDFPGDQPPPPYSTATPSEPSKSVEASDNHVSRKDTEPLPPYERESEQTRNGDPYAPGNEQSSENTGEPKKKPKWYQR